MSLADALGWVGVPFVAAGAYFLVAGLFTGSREKQHLANAFYAIGNWVQFLAFVLAQDPFGSALTGLAAAYFTWLWWRNRRSGRGRKAFAELGAKSRARVQSLVDQMTPSPIPSPVGAAA